ncbi:MULTISPECIES: hypothetical protein [unclassified Streptomyces]|uniref:hypothetical protein n=1 Tax=unclassified Streptomyces TaxID=2593676 RepID=UPI00035F4C6F|nr:MULTISPECIES: hypothetical protein [unclassified Streptomyces]MYT34121.1 hypothetical protein [Streptomyces sp. SID8354]
MNTATTSRFRGRAGRRIAAAVVTAAALGLGVTACGQGSGAARPAGSSSPSAAADSQNASNPPQSTSGASSDNSGSQGHNGGKTGTAPSAARGSGSGTHAGAGRGTGSGVAHAGNHRTIIGTLTYLAPGKLTVKPQGGGMEQAFLISNATRILGAAAICSVDDGTVTVGKDGYGTSKCTVEQLEKAAKTSSVTVRVTMNPKSGAAETVEEKYHP